MEKKRRDFWPIVVCSVIAMSATGCIIVPLPLPPPNPLKIDVQSMVGDRTSSKPVRPGATREQVHLALGQARNADDLRSWEHYDAQRQYGRLWILFLFGHGGGVLETPMFVVDSHLLVEYDESGIVKAANLSGSEEFERKWDDIQTNGKGP